MAIKSIAITSARIISLTLVLFFCIVMFGGVVMPEGEASQGHVQQGESAQVAAPKGREGIQTTPVEQAKLALVVLGTCFVQVLVIAPLLLGSHWRRWRLVGTVFLAFFGINTFLAQIESLIYLTNLPPGFVPRLLLFGALVAAVFSSLGVLICGKWRRGKHGDERSQRLVMPVREWVWKLTVIAVSYVVLYYSFGFLVAWRNPELRNFYQGMPGSNPSQMSLTDTFPQLIILVQVFRALLWTCILIPVIKMLKGKPWHTVVAVSLLCALLPTVQLLLPNPYMPKAVAMTHFIETAPSNLIFGGLVASLLLLQTQRSVNMSAKNDGLVSLPEKDDGLVGPIKRA